MLIWSYTKWGEGIRYYRTTSPNIGSRFRVSKALLRASKYKVLTVGLETGGLFVTTCGLCKTT